MGNATSCFSAQSTTAKLIDLNSKAVRVVALPATAADLMFEEPGYFISPVSDLRRDRRFSALKAEELLAGGGVYLLIPISRVKTKASESEMAAVESLCGSGAAKRRSSKVLPFAAEVSGEGCFGAYSRGKLKIYCVSHHFGSLAQFLNSNGEFDDSSLSL